MNLTATEIAYLDRFCYEVDHFLHGEGSVFQECPGHYQDLGALTNFAPPEIKTRWENRDRQAPPGLPFRGSLWRTFRIDELNWNRLWPIGNEPLLLNS